ncbi:MAG: hypothetical protein EA379_11370 [Phycisphaerales bacterium]|nr:MAG: hypothetical protein EA379_11370 [Phycisphaerales bacterium]
MESEHVSREIMMERLFEALITGDRPAARAVVDEAIEQGTPPENIVSELFWPTYEVVERLHREDKLTRMCHHLATRLLRVLVDQTSARFTQGAHRNKTVFAVCGPTDADELSAQIAVDLMEADGYSVCFPGGGIAIDEILEHVQERRPDLLLLFASAPCDLPEIRRLIDTIREIGACDVTQIAVGGGVFNRADGLAEEIGADLWATSPMEIVELVGECPEQRATPGQRTVGRKRKKAA